AFLDDDVRELLETGAYDQLEALATKYPDLKAGIYHQAILQARFDGDMDRVRKMIDRFPADDPEMRQMLQSLMERMEGKPTITDEKLAEIQATAELSSNPTERVRYLLMVSGQLAVIDRKATFKFLDQANQVTDTMKPGKE